MAINRKSDLSLSAILDTDSYKFSHFLQYPEGMETMFSYLESRGGAFDTCTLFGLQAIVHKYLSKTFTLEDVEEAEAFAAAHGEPFSREGWLHVLEAYRGHLPVRIRAIPEGLVVPVRNAILTVECIDPKCFWITNWLETMLSRVWYPSTVAIMSREAKKTWKEYLELTSDDPGGEIGFKHHDFGARGVTSQEQAMFGGAAHLLSFLGSDTVAGIAFANHYYDCAMAGFSIPATEHSTMTVWGREHEDLAIKNWVTKTLVDRQVPPGMPKLAACVGDSYDIFGFVEKICRPEILNLVKHSGGTLVVRPDSGDPIEVLTKVFHIFENNLPAGSVVRNKKGYKVLPSYFRIIWGDGINLDSMRKILEQVTASGWSASNLAFGSGGGLLQACNRDTQKFAFKCSHATVNGRSVDVLKDPVTDPGKRSKAGRLDLVRNADGTLSTVVLEQGETSKMNSVMVDYFVDGKITYETTFDDIRDRMSL
jgi:nicotinamide phosphoribosyltransferase